MNTALFKRLSATSTTASKPTSIATVTLDVAALAVTALPTSAVATPLATAAAQAWEAL